MNNAKARREEGDRYGLQRNFISSIRLNAQHYLWKDAVGYNINPKIPARNNSTYRIADVGTGTGIWVYDVKKEYPNAQVDGFDLSLDQAPVAQWMPRGSSMNILDITKPVPERLRGKYDLVHVRLFLVVINGDNVAPVMRNLVDLLKPGGWLQWGEHVVSDFAVEAISAQQGEGALHKLLKLMDASGEGSWVARLPDAMRAEGMLDASMEKHPLDPAARVYWTQMQFNSTMDYTYVAMDNSTADSAGPKARELVAKAVLETRQGLAWSFKPAVAIARKSSARPVSSVFEDDPKDEGYRGGCLVGARNLVGRWWQRVKGIGSV